MLRRYSVDITFGRQVSVFQTRGHSRQDVYAKLGLRPYDERDWPMLIRGTRLTSTRVVAMLDDDFDKNGEFAVASDESELLAAAQSFAKKLYDLHSCNYDHRVRRFCLA
jgi:hypothetical protein